MLSLVPFTKIRFHFLLRFCGWHWIIALAMWHGSAWAMTIDTDSVPLADGGTTPRIWLRNNAIEVAFLPELGGKITHLQTTDGWNVISRSDRPRQARDPGMAFGDTAFDGIDEIFPTLAAGPYPTGSWTDTNLPAHGELFRQAWRHVPGTGVNLEVDGLALPYTFRRQATLNGSTLILDYTVTNHAHEPLYALYAFHPLWRGTAELEVAALTPETKVTRSWSDGGWLGTPGTRTTLAGLCRPDGPCLTDNLFVPQSGHFYKFFTTTPHNESLTLDYGAGRTLHIRWPAKLFPYYAVWSSEGGVDGLQHWATEPTVGPHDGLDAAYAADQALRIPPQGDLTWRIELELSRAPYQQTKP